MIYNYGMSKEKTSYALTEDCRKLLTELARKLGLSRTAIIELAVRRLAQAEGVHVEGAQDSPKPHA
jgi:biotin operon repressor